MTPIAEPGNAQIDIEALIPHTIGEWVAKDTGANQVSLETNDEATNSLPAYDQVLMRTYHDDHGNSVMLAIAYARQQHIDLQIHRPELCYYAHGFSVSKLADRRLNLSSAQIPLKELIATNAHRREPVTYWIRIDDKIVANAWDARWTILRRGIRGHIGDGVLVRASSLVNSDSELDDALAMQRRFIASVYQSLPPRGQTLLIGNSVQNQ